MGFCPYFRPTYARIVVCASMQSMLSVKGEEKLKDLGSRPEATRKRSIRSVYRSRFETRSRIESGSNRFIDLASIN